MAVGRAELVFLPSAGEIFQVLVISTRLVLSPWMLPYAVSSNVTIAAASTAWLSFVFELGPQRIGGYFHEYSPSLFMVGSRRGTG